MRKIYKGISSLIMTAFCALGASAQNAVSVPADDIPSSLKDATEITLTGEWGTSEFGQLKAALGTNVIMGSNTTLTKLDMSKATIAEGTSLYVSAGFSSNGAFINCKSLKEVVMPAAAEAAKFTKFQNAFQNCVALETIDLSGLANVTTFNMAFYGCAALQHADLSTNTAAVTSGAWTSAFEDCAALTEVRLPVGFVPTEKVFSDCAALQTLDWTTCTATEEAPAFNAGMLEGVELSGVTLKLNHEQYVLFAADAEGWAQLKLEDQNPEPEPEPEPSTEYTVSADDIPSSLKDATEITLTGEWGNSEFSQLKTALGMSGFMVSPNTTLEKVDMSQATIAEGTSLLISGGLSSNGLFFNCKALKEVVMPAATEAAKFTSFEKAFSGCAALETIDLSGLTNVTTFKEAFYGCAALQQADLSTNTAAVTSGAWTSAFEDCAALTEVKLPAGFVPTEKVFSGCTALQALDWTACTATEEAPVFYAGMLEGVELSGVTLKLNHEQYVLFAADAEGWAQLKLEDQNPEPEPEPEPSTEYTVAADDIPSSLKDATVVTLTGEWDGDAFNSLCMAMIDSPTLGTSENNTLQKVDMSAATIAEGTSLFRAGYPQGYGIFRNFKALKEVVMPAAAEAAKFTSLAMAFQNCSSLTTIDLSGCAGVTSLENAFSGCSALQSADLSAMAALENTDGAFENCEALASVVLPAQFPLGDNTFAYCNALTAIDWTAFAGTEVPELGGRFFMGVDDLKAISLSLTYEAWKLFSADEDWSELTLVNTEPEKVTDFTVDASEATELSSLWRAVTLTLTGEWDSDALNLLSLALGNNGGIGNPVNATLEKVDMSAAIIAEGTELYRHEYLEYGIFNRCTALKEVILPAAEEAAKFTNLTKAFEGCTALTDIDLSLLTGATDIDYAFSGTAITKADLSGCTSLGSTVSAFEGCAALEEVALPACFMADNNTFADCTALKTIDFTAWKDATAAPACKGNTFAGLDDPATVTLKVDATCHEVFEADSRWGDFNIVYDGKPDGVRGVRAADGGVPVTVYTVDGHLVGTFTAGEDWTCGLKPGLYIANGRKVAVGR